jgi:hypothetical protein
LPDLAPGLEKLEIYPDSILDRNRSVSKLRRLPGYFGMVLGGGAEGRSEPRSNALKSGGAPLRTNSAARTHNGPNLMYRKLLGAFGYCRLECF